MKNAQFDQLFDQLVPASGKADTLAGEVIRAAGRLAYDFYNNGMGNNTSGAIHFLDRQSAIKSEDFATVYPYTRGRVYSGSYEGDAFQNAIDSIVETATQFVLLNPVTMTIPQEQDMFDFEEEEERFCEECGDTIEEGYSGWLCEHCYECQCEEEYV